MITVELLQRCLWDIFSAQAGPRHVRLSASVATAPTLAATRLESGVDGAVVAGYVAKLGPVAVEPRVAVVAPLGAIEARTGVVERLSAVHPGVGVVAMAARAVELGPGAIEGRTCVVEGRVCVVVWGRCAIHRLVTTWSSAAAEELAQGERCRGRQDPELSCAAYDRLDWGMVPGCISFTAL